MSEEEFYELKGLMEQAEESQVEMNRFQSALIDYCNKLVTEIYGDQLLTMESKGFTDINEVISRAALRLTCDINDIVFNNQVEE